MKGIVKRLTDDRKREKLISGVIWGEDKYEYHFKLPKERVAFSEGDEVMFDERDDGREFTTAINIRPISNEVPKEQAFKEAVSHIQKAPNPNNSIVIEYYRPGLHESLKGEENMRKTEQNHLKHDSGEREVIEKLQEVLRISHINHHDMGSSHLIYPYCIVGATSYLKRFIRDRSEFLLIFSHFPNCSWQQSTNQAASQIRRRKEVVLRRPCVNFYMLVSNANDLIEQIDKMKGGTEAAIIPFSFQELLATSNKEELIRLINSRFEEYYFENNMLNEEQTIMEDSLLFGDRGKIADAIVARCKEKKHSGIFGLRRSGKSSVLRAVERRLINEKIKYTIIEARSELENVDWKQSLYNIAKKIRQATLGIDRGERSIDEFEKELKLNSTIKDYDREATARFVDDVKQYIRNEDDFVLAIDEIELITYNSATSSEWKSLESYKAFWGALRDCGCSVIVCGVNSTINENSRITVGDNRCDNPMYQRIHLIGNSEHTYLPPFTDEQTKTMINTLGGFSNISFSQVYTEINRAFGGQPYPIRKFCSFIYEKVKHLRTTGDVFEVTKPTFEACFDEFNHSNDGVDLYNTILEHIEIYKDEYRLLTKLAHNPSKYRNIAPENASAIDHLKKYGLIAYDNTTGLMSFKIESLRQYICSFESKDPEDMDNRERRRYVQDCVAELEANLKEHIRRYYQYSNPADGIKMFKTAIKKYNDRIHPQNNKIDVNSLSLNDFFDIHKIEFYFSTIRIIISDNWSTLGSAFKREGFHLERFKTYMMDLNAGRTDADHYTAASMNDIADQKWEISDQTMKRFKTAYEELSGVLKAIL